MYSCWEAYYVGVNCYFIIEKTWKSRVHLQKGQKSNGEKTVRNYWTKKSEGTFCLSSQKDSVIHYQLLQGIYDISTTSTKSTDEVIHELECVLQQLSIQYLRNG